MSPSLALTFFLLAGTGLSLYYAARLSKIQFSLKTIFVLVTAVCVSFGYFASVGTSGVESLLMFFLIALPLANLLFIAVCVVYVAHCRGEEQAVAVGRLIPLVGVFLLSVIQFQWFFDLNRVWLFVIRRY